MVVAGFMPISQLAVCSMQLAVVVAMHWMVFFRKQQAMFVVGFAQVST